MSNLNDIIYNLALGIPGLLLAITCHEVGHGLMALKFGDPTAKNSGRLTLNPVVHLDIFGSILMPLIGAVVGGVIFGWAKPVPVDSRYFKEVRKGIFWVSFAGPLTNFILVIISAFISALCMTKLPDSFYLKEPLQKIFEQSVIINTIIGVFNLIPFPPLDGSKMVSAYLSYNAQRKYDEIGQYSFFFYLILIFTGATRYLFLPALALAQIILNLFIYIFH